jgi:hypothetical protein
MKVVPFCTILFLLALQKISREMKKASFAAKNLETHFSTIFRHAKTHLCAKYSHP